MVSLHHVRACVLLALVDFGLALVARTASVTPAPTATTSAPISPITLAPGFVVTTTVIQGKTYPVMQLGGQGGYDISGTGYSFSGLLGITLANNYSTLPGGYVFPVIDLVVAEADTENFTIPGVLTFFDGGAKTSGKQTTDFVCTAGIGGATCSDLEGRVTGALLGVPFTQLGGIEPGITIPQSSGGTFMAGFSAQATAIEGPLSDVGAVGGGIIAGPSFTSLGLAASGDGDSLGVQGVAFNGTTIYQIGICETKVIGVCKTATS